MFERDQWAPGLALSRCFGDTRARPIGVVSEPEFTAVRLPRPPAPPTLHPLLGQQQQQQGQGQAGNGLGSGRSSGSSVAGGSAPPPAAASRHVLIVASDGLWEFISSSRAVAIACAFPTPAAAAGALLEAARKQWALRYRGRNCDDVTIAVAFFPA